MSVAEWVDTYGIHHWRILWSSYRKFAWVGFKPMTTEFRSDAPSDWAIRPWVQLALRANFVQLPYFHRLFSATFHFGCCLRQSSFIFSSNFCWGNHMSVPEWVNTYAIHHWMILWSSYRKFAWVGFEPMTTEFRSDALTDWATKRVRKYQNSIILKLYVVYIYIYIYNCRKNYICIFFRSSTLKWDYIYIYIYIYTTHI